MTARHQTREVVTLHALFECQRPDEYPVCHDGDVIVSWRDFSTKITGLCRRLQRREEDRWLLSSDKPFQFCLGLFAALYAGKQVVIPPNGQPGTLQAIGDAFDATLDDLFINALEPGSGEQKLPAAIDPHRAFIDLYTSGSTGRHKRIRKTLVQFQSEVDVLEMLWGERLGPAAIVATVPHQHIYGLLFRLFWPLAAGRVFDAVTCTQPDILKNRLGLFERTALVSSPAHLARLPELIPLAELTPRPVLVFSSRGALPVAAAEKMRRDLGRAPIEVFGSTETGGVAWRQQQDDVGRDLWTPFPGHDVSCSARGALLLRSSFLADDSPWEMDDAIEQMPDGRFRLGGRLDRIVKIEEKRLSLPEMELRLGEHAWVAEAVIVPLAGRRQAIGAVVMATPEGRAQLAADGRRRVAQVLRDHLAAYFEAVLLPRHWRFPEQLPTDERGKLAQTALVGLFAQTGDKSVLPEILDVRFTGAERQSVVLDLIVKEDLEHFRGHFPGAAILPGVVQVDWAIRLAHTYLKQEKIVGFSALENLKFLSIIHPETRLQLSLTWDHERKRLDFSYFTELRKYSSGRVIFGGDE